MKQDARHNVGRITGYAAIACLLLAVTGWVFKLPGMTGPAIVAFFASLAIGFTGHRTLRGYAFTMWVLVFVAASLVRPAAFGTWFGFDLKILIVPLIQIIMFGMGTTLSVSDFGRVLQMPWPVLVGLVLQFSIMPTLAYLLAATLGFEPEIAAGIVLIGSCPGGVASNLMVYLARGNVALSVTMTACSTLLSPLMTPLMMKIFAAQYIDIDFVDMMLAICNMIIVPILAGLVANRILYSGRQLFQGAWSLAVIAAVSFGGAFVVGWSGSVWLGALTTGVVLGSILVGVVALAKLVVELLFDGPKNWMDRALPVLSMVGICYIIAIITARSAEDLLHVGVLLLAASILHNLVGYTLGFWLARLSRLNERDCRTVAFEVGMQNGGMASGLAINALQSVQAALAPAIFGPWMNVSGSMLATYWRNRPVVTMPQQSQPAAGKQSDSGDVTRVQPVLLADESDAAAGRGDGDSGQSSATRED